MNKRYSNALLEIVQATDIAPKEFGGEHLTDVYPAFRLVFRDTPLAFVFRMGFSQNKRVFDYKFYEFELGHPPVFNVKEHVSSWYDFEVVKKAFRDWLEKCVKGYLQYLSEEAEDDALPDLWAQLDRSEEAAADFRALQNTSFSLDEQKRIAMVLEEFEETVASEKLLSDEQLGLLHERVEYLVDASRRLGRKDWISAAAGAFLGFALQAGLTSVDASRLIQLAGEALRWIAHSPLLLQ